MIIIRSEKGEIYNLFTKPKHVVGRNGNLELEGDKSVSRQHAVIFVAVKDKKPLIKLQDLSSKFGTFVNGTEIAKNTITLLKVGDKIKFGLQWNTWQLEESQLVVCVSTLPAQQKSAITSLISNMNGICLTDWNDSCTHLTMNEILITQKVVQALVRVKPLVSLEYWTILADIMNSVKEEPIPDCDDYVPPLKDKRFLNSTADLKMTNSRRKLFNNTYFVACTTSQYNTILSMVSNAGGTVVDGTVTAISEEQLKNNNIIVLDSNTVNKRNRNLVQLLKFLETNKLRRIPESEISLSLILNSTEMFCNPRHDPAFILRQTESQIVIKDEESILDQETQDLGDENSTQFFDSDSISLAVNDDQRIFSDSDEDAVILDTPPVPQPAPEPVVEQPPAKRKRNDLSEQPKSKTVKLDNWLTRKPCTRSSTATNSPSPQPENSKKPLNSLFAFNRGNKETEKSSVSLFKTLRSSSCNETDSVENKRKRGSGSVELFASCDSPAPPLKRANVEKKDIFQSESTSKQQKSGSLSLFESDSVDACLEKTSKLRISGATSNKENSNVASKNTQFSKLIAPPITKIEVKDEPEDSFDRKDDVNRSVILTLPLIKPHSQSTQSLNSTNGSAVNFKKFRKNNGSRHTVLISSKDLVLFEIDQKFKEEPLSLSNSDSD